MPDRVFEAERLEVLATLDRSVDQVNEKHDGMGFAEFILALKRGVFDLVKVCETHSLRPKKKSNAA